MISKKLDIQKEEVYNNILSFQIWAGKPYRPARYLIIDEDIVYGLGLYIAEGKNTDKKLHRAGIANSEDSILRFIAYWFQKYFNIGISDLKFYANIPNNSNPSNIKKHIQNKFMCPKNHIKCYKNKFANSITVDIVIDCKPLRLFIEWLKINIVPKFYGDMTLGVAFLQGVFDGEGHVRKNQAEIIVEMEDTSVLDMCELILRNLGIRPNRYKNNKVLTIEARDFPKLKNIMPFKFHEKRKDAFKKVFQQIKLIQAPRNLAMLNILKYLHYKGPSNSVDMAFDVGYKNKNSVCRIYNEAKKLGYVKVNGRGLNDNPCKISITKLGKSYVKESNIKELNRIKILKENITKW